MKKQQTKRKVPTEVLKARGHLRGALNDLFDDTDIVELSSTRQTTKHVGKETFVPVPQRGRPPKRPIEATKVLSPARSARATNSVVASPSKTPSRRKTQPQAEPSSSSDHSDIEEAQQPKQAKGVESFIMKLFERSVDLSKFTEKTPLYPICRAWFKNQPRNVDLLDEKPIKTEVSLPRDIDGAALYARVLRHEVTEIFKMPRPLPTKLPKIPPVYKPAAGYDIAAIDAALRMGATGTWSDNRELLDNHKLRWRLVRKEWIKHTVQYRHERFKYNYLIIQQLYKQSKLQK